MGNILSFSWKDTFWLALVALLVAEIMLPGSISIVRDLLGLTARIAYSCYDHSQHGLTASDIPIPEDLFGNATVDGSTPPTQDPIIHDKSRSDRICGYVDVRRQFTPGKFALFYGQGAANSVGGRQPGLLGQDDSDSSSRVGTTKGHRRDLSGSMNRALDASNPSRSDSVDEAASISSTATTTSNISTKAVDGSATSLPAVAPRTAGMWAAARNVILAKPITIKERYYCVLKKATIYLYDDDKQTEPVHVIPVDKYIVKIFTSEGEFKGRDGEMFNKKNAVVLQHHTRVESDDGLPGTPMSRKNSPTFNKMAGDEEPWYLFIKNHSQMEDWYLALQERSHGQISHEKVYSKSDMHKLVNTITNEVDPIASRWINSLLGTLFLRICETAFAEKFIIGRIMRKLNKMPKDGYWRDIVIREVNLGTVPPSIHRPMLKDIQASGQTAIDFHFCYDARKEVATKPDAAFRIAFAAVFTYGPVSVPIVAAAKINYIEGDMTAQIKPAPSNRIWYGFTSEPKMELDIGYSVMQSRAFSNNVIIDQIRKKIKTAISDALVVPNMDDLPFFSTVPDEARGVPEGYPRGGIFDLASKMMASETDRVEVSITQGQSSKQPGIAINTANIQGGKQAKNKTSPTKRDKSPSKYKGQGISSASFTPPKKRSPIRASIPLPGMGFNKKKDKVDELMIHKNVTEPTLTTEPMLITDPNDVDTRGRLEHQRAEPPRARKISPDSINSLGLESSARSSDTDTIAVRPQTIHGDGSGTPGTVDSNHTQSSISPARRTGGVMSSWTRPLSTTSNDLKDLEPAAPISRTSSRSDSVITPVDQAQPGDKDSATRSPAPAVDHTAAAAISAASVLDLFKARDRQGLEAKGNVAKTRFAKWGTESLARGKAELQRLKEERMKSTNASAQSPSIPVPNQSQVSSTTTHTTGTSPTAHLGRSPGKTLQERLRETARAAEAANAATLGHHTDGRVRSGSNTSNPSSSSSSAARPALLSSPSKGEPSISGTDFVSATHHNNAESTSLGRRSSASTSLSTTPPVLAQPAAGKGMVVPRMTKRSGEVTGLGGGKRAEQGDIVDKSESNGFTDLPAETRDTTTINIGPPLPPRDNSSEPKTETDSTPIGKSGSSRPFPTMTGASAPPPLPSRKDRPVSPIATKSNSLIGLANLGHEDEVSMERSSSLPGQPRQAPAPVEPKNRPTSMGMGVRSLSFSHSRGSKGSGSKGKQDGKGSVSDMAAFERSLSFEDMLNEARGPEGLEDAGDGEDAVVMTKKEKKKPSPSRAQHALRKFSDKPTSPTTMGELRLGSHV